VTETGRRLRGKAIDDALDPVFEVDLADIEGIVLAILLCVLGALCVRAFKRNLTWLQQVSGLQDSSEGDRLGGGFTSAATTRIGFIVLGRRTSFFWHPVLPHKCGVPPGYGTPHLCGSEELVRSILRATIGVHLPVGFATGLCQCLQKTLPILVVLENRLPPVAPFMRW
jgi:hypothetical protein